MTCMAYGIKIGFPYIDAVFLRVTWKNIHSKSAIVVYVAMHYGLQRCEMEPHQIAQVSAHYSAMNVTSVQPFQFEPKCSKSSEGGTANQGWEEMWNKVCATGESSAFSHQLFEVGYCNNHRLFINEWNSPLWCHRAVCDVLFWTLTKLLSCWPFWSQKRPYLDKRMELESDPWKLIGENCISLKTQRK